MYRYIGIEDLVASALIELMKREEHKKLLDVLALSKVPPDEVCLKPILLKRK